MIIQTLFRVVAVTCSPFALLQFFGAMSLLGEWVRQRNSGDNATIVATSIPLATMSLQMLTASALLAVPLVIWLLGDWQAVLAKRAGAKDG